MVVLIKCSIKLRHDSIFLGYFECQCPNTWAGIKCNVYDKTFLGGIGKATSSENSVPEICQKNSCPEKSSNGVCDVSNNLPLPLSVFIFIYVSVYNG